MIFVDLAMMFYTEKCVGFEISPALPCIIVQYARKCHIKLTPHLMLRNALQYRYFVIRNDLSKKLSN